MATLEMRETAEIRPFKAPAGIGNRGGGDLRGQFEASLAKARPVKARAAFRNRPYLTKWTIQTAKAPYMMAVAVQAIASSLIEYPLVPSTPNECLKATEAMSK